MRDTHFADWDAGPRRGLRRALCGVFIREREHANEPTCARCRVAVEQRRQAEEDDARTLLRLQQATAEDFGGPPEKHQPFNPTAGYVRHGQPRTR